MTAEAAALIERAKRARSAVFLATDASVAEDISAIIGGLLALIPEPPTVASVEEWSAAMDAERQRQIEHGYDDAHDREHGPVHILNWAIDYARRGRVLEAATMMRSVLHMLSAEPPTDDERAGIERLAEGVIIAFVQAQARAAQDLTQHQSITTIPAVADRIMASPEWRNRHRGPITDEMVEAALAVLRAEVPGERSQSSAVRAALEAAEAAR